MSERTERIAERQARDEAMLAGSLATVLRLGRGRHRDGLRRRFRGRRPLATADPATGAGDPAADRAALDDERRARQARGESWRRVRLDEGWHRAPDGVLIVVRSGHPWLITARRNGCTARPCERPDAEPVPVDRAFVAATGRHALVQVPVLGARAGIGALLGRSVASSRRELLAVAAASLVGGALGLLVPLAAGVVFDPIVPYRQFQRLVALVVTLLLVVATVAVLGGYRGRLLARARARVDRASALMVFERMLALPVSFFGPFSAGDLGNRVSGLLTLRMSLSDQVITSGLVGTMSLVNVALLWSAGPVLGLVATGLVLSELAVIALLTRQQTQGLRSALDAGNATAGIMVQAFRGIETIRLANAESRVVVRWAGPFTEQVAGTMAVTTALGRVATVVLVWSTMGTLAVTSLVFTGLPTDAGEFMSMVTALTMALSGTAALAGVFGVIASTSPQLRQLDPILQATPEERSVGAWQQELTGQVRVQHLSFAYPGSDGLALADVTFEAMPGQMIAFVGPSGAGKSTLVRLLLGFDRPTQGTVSYDDRDLRTLDPRMVRRQIGTVLQSAELMPATIAMNVAGSAGLTREEVWRALDLAGVGDDIRGWPMGLDTFVGDQMSISGGQAQRIVIARALASHPRLLIFDEATSALDNASQAQVKQTLSRLGVTRIVIAHRLSTVVDADCIHVLDGGSVVQSGTFEELSSVDGLFRDLTRAQLL